MTLVALWLLALGVADLVRWHADDFRAARDVAAIVTGTITLGAVALLADLGPGWVLRTLLVGGVLLAAWVLTSSRSLAVQPSRATSRVLPPLGVLTLVTGALLALSGVTPDAGGPLRDWYDGLEIPPLAGIEFERFLVAAGALAFLQNSANIVVRLVLVGSGTPPVKGEETLQGGRVLGPMERSFIFALGAAGQLTAASIVVAAKGILRFPEIRYAAERHRGGPDQITEYFLIGTLASWLVALALLALV